MVETETIVQIVLFVISVLERVKALESDMWILDLESLQYFAVQKCVKIE